MGMIEVHIEELVLRGPNRLNRRDLAESIRQALTRQLSVGGPPRAWSKPVVLSELRTKPVETATNRMADTVGEAIARCLAMPPKNGKGRS